MVNSVESSLPGDTLAAWLANDQPAVNADCERRVIALPDTERWTSTPDGLLELRILEYLPAADRRLTALCRLRQPDVPASLDFSGNTELFVRNGVVTCGERRWAEGCYIRRPDCASGVPRLTAGSEADPSAPATLLYFSTGQLADTDTEYREIDTTDTGLWLPGPVDGVEVMALHGHRASNAMLVRWQRSVTFQPRLDPAGEEILVLEGCLHDASGDYPPGTWIRNPIPAWQSWAGDEHTLVLYKSGHFFSETGDT